MKTLKLFTAFSLFLISMIAGCKEDNFTEINGIIPEVISTNPAQNANGVLLEQVISVVFSGKMDSASINPTSFTLQAEAPVQGTISCFENTASFTPANPLLPNTTYTVRLKSSIKNEFSNTLRSDYVWTFRTGISPEVISIKPANLATNINLKPVISATFSMPIDSLTFSDSTFTLKHGQTTVRGTLHFSDSTLFFTPADSLLPNTLYSGLITREAKSKTGIPLSAIFEWNFITDVSPGVVSTNPLNTATGVVLNKQISVNFTVQMDPASFNSTSFSLKDGEKPVAGMVLCSGLSATFIPDNNLNPATVYTASLSTSVKNSSGTPLPANYVWSFTTVSVVVPTVILTDPLPSSAQISLSKVISATFSVPMDPLTIAGSTFFVKNGDLPVSGSVSYSGSTAIFTPTSQLLPGATYTATLTSGIKNLEGTSLASDYVWSFSTHSDPAPTVLTTDPLNFTTSVPLNKLISATFNVPMDPLTITTSTFLLKSGSVQVEGTVSWSGQTATFSPSELLSPATVYTATLTSGAKNLYGTSLADNFLWSFTTTSDPVPQVVSTDPSNLATSVPQNQIISATFNVLVDPQTVTATSFRLDCETGPVSGTISVNGKTVSFSPSSLLTCGQIYTATLTSDVKNQSGTALSHNYVWSFNSVSDPAPMVFSTDPNNLETSVGLDKNISATFNVQMNQATLTNSTFTLKMGSVSVPGTVSYSGLTALFSPAENLIPNTIYTGQLTTDVKNLQGTPLENAYTWSFQTVSSKPTVLSTDPENLATSVPLNKTVTAIFSTPMDPLTITSSTFILKNGATIVTGNLSYSGSTLTFDPGTDLIENTIYTGTVTTGVKNLNGTSLANNFVWSFQTVSSKPTVLSTDPENLATSIALNKTVTATFSTPMDPLTITSSTFTLKNGSTTVAGVLSYSGSILTFDPASDLIENTVYTGMVTTGAKNLSGTPLSNNYVWSFSTVNSLTPTVISTDPENLATSIALNKTVTATFSTPMDPLTITSSTFTLKDGLTTVAGVLSYSGSILTFDPASDLIENTVYTGTITTGAKNLAGTPLANNYVWSFTTANSLTPTVISTDPENLATSVALNKTVTATFSVPMDPLTITSSTFTLKNGAIIVPGVLSYSGSILTFNPTSDLTSNTVYTGTITTGAKNLAGTALANNFVWSFTTANALTPTVISTDPENLATSVSLNKTVTATFSVPMDPLTITSSTFTLKNGAIIVPGVLSYSGSILTFNPTSDLTSNTVYTGTITTGAKDLAGTPLSNNFIWSFSTVNALAPTVISTDPENLATSVGLNKTVTATFSVPMDPLTITSSTFTLKNGAIIVPGVLSYSGSILTFNPTSDLTSNTVYTGTITTGAKDLAGTPLSNNFIWSFSTVNALAPTVISTDPENLATSVGLNKTVTATFSTPMDPLTITSSTFTLKNGPTTIAGTLTYSGSVLTFNPTADLVAGTSYTGMITTGAKDLAGTPLSNNYIWSFSTVGAIIPTVISTDPMNLAINVPLNKIVSATFSTPMDPLTITGSTFTLKAGAVSVLGVVDYSGSTATFTPNSDLLPGTLYSATITTSAKTPLSIPLENDYSWTFTTGNSPIVISTDPLNLAINVPLNKIVSATFSTPMDPLTITGSTFTLKAGAVSVLGVVDYSGSTATFTPNSDLQPGTLYSATITTSAKTPLGIPLENDFNWTFTTGNSPTIISTDPMNLAINVPLNKIVSATFSTPMDPLTITGSTFTLKAGAVSVLGVVDYSGSTATFTPNSDLLPGTLYSATITTSAKSPLGIPLENDFNWTFTTGNSPTVISTDPLNLAINVPLNKIVSATFSTPMDPLTITGSTFTLKAGAVSVLGVVDYSGSTATFTPNSDLLPGTLYSATVTTSAKTPLGIPLENDYSWTFTTGNSPTVISTDPMNLAINVPLNKIVSATFSTPMDPLTITGSTFTLKAGAVSVLGVVDYSGSTATFTPNSDLLPGTLYSATITTSAKTPLGIPIENDYSWTFTTGNSPTVISTDPLNLAINVPLNKIVSATFSTPMDPLTITGSTFTLKAGAVSVLGVVDYSGSTATFTPNSDLLPGTLYSATITTSAKSPLGIPLENDYSWTFTTGNSPTVISTDPLNLAINVPLNKIVSATFSTPMDPLTITGSTFTLKAGAVSVLGVVDYSGSTATFTPNSDLLPGTLYSATITTSAKTPLGIPLENDFSWTFTTGNSPTVISTDPMNLAINVPLNKIVSATFSTPMDPLTITGSTFTLKAGAVSVLGIVDYSGSTATFTPNSDLLPGTLYSATITNSAKTPLGIPLENDFNWTFTTGNSPTIISTDPMNLAINVPLNKIVSATFSTPMDPLTITGSTFTLKAGAVSVLGVVDYSGSTATFTPNSDLLPGTLYSATITTSAKTPLGIPLESDYSWTFTTGNSPTIISTDPMNLAINVPLNKIVSATFSTPMNPLTITGSTFTLKAGAVSVLGIVDYSGSTATFTPNSDLLPGTLYSATITTSAKTPLGIPLQNDFNWTFTTGNSPTIISTDPLNLAINVPLNKIVSATFSTPMDPLTITGSTFTLKAGAVSVLGVVDYSGSTATFTPNSDLLPGTLYSATITTSAKSPLGIPLQNDFNWTFTTGNSPTVISTDPMNLAINVPLNKIVSATFSTPMDPLTITGSTFTLKAGAVSVLGVVDYSGSTATFTPNSDLLPGTLYSATITTSAKSPLGIPLENDFNWTFTTGNSPTIISTDPMNLAINVPLNKIVSATFSTPMDPLTITGSTFTLKAGAVSVLGVVDYSGSTATFTPNSDLLPGTLYSATITTSAKTPLGIPLENDYSWTFTTGNSPTIISTDPMNLAINVPLNKIVSATFSTPMDPLTITGSTFTLKAGAVSVLGVVDYFGSTATFTPNSDLLPGTLYSATITTSAKTPLGIPLENDFNWTFTTGNSPTVISTDPLNLAINVPLNKIVSATFSTPMDPLTITGSTFTLKAGAVSVLGVVNYSGSTATFTPNSDLLPGTLYSATITTSAKSPLGIPLENDFNWTFTTGNSPTVISTDPLNLAINVPLNKIVSATFSTPMDPLTITGSTFTLKAGAVSVLGVVDYSGSTATFTPNSDLLPGTLYSATISTSAKSPLGIPLENDYSWTFTTGNSPTVISTDPMNLAINVPLNKIVSATFSTPMDPLTITGSTFTLKAGAVSVLGVVDYSGSTATFTPNSDLLPGTLYSATVTTSAKTPLGIPLENDFNWTFTTGNSPTVISTDPMNLAINVPLNKIVSATFSTPMDPLTITGSTFTLKAGAVSVLGVVDYSGSTATFTPNSDLLPGTLYSATITTSAKSPLGIPLENDYSWTFTTGNSPTVISTDPMNLAINVPLNKIVSATFSTPMDPLTITGSTFTLKAGAVSVLGVVDYSGSTATFTPNSDLLPGTLYSATITTSAKTPLGIPLENDFNWTFTTGNSPTVISTDPLNLAINVPLNKIVSATFSTPMDPLTITGSTFTLKAGAVSVLGVVDYSGSTATFTPNSDLLPGTLYSATITTSAKTPLGIPLENDFNWTFTTGNSPTVISTDPLNLAINVPLNKIVSATFSTPMDPLTITGSTFTLKAGAVSVLGVVDYSGSTATFTPNSDLLPGTLYSATITTSAKTPLGIPIENDYSWTFTTGNSPTVISTDPLNLAINVPLNKIVSATFSTPMDPLTITGSTFTLKAGAVSVLGVVDYSGSTATFTPNSDLLPGTLYSATITTSAKTPLGIPLASDYTWTFTTDPSPTVISTDPANNETGVPLDQIVSATFSVPMNSATLTTLTFTLVSGSLPVTGVVSYAGSTVTFTPASGLLSGTTYTATITIGAENPLGTPLAANYVWTFSTVPPLGPAFVELNTAARFGILAGVGVSNNAGFSEIHDMDVGITPGLRAAISGFPPAVIINGASYAPDDGSAAAAILSSAKQDLTDAYNFAEAATSPAPVIVAGDQGGTILSPGIYKSTSTLAIQAGDLTLDAQGDVNAVWIFQIATSLTSIGGAGGNVILIGGAQARNVFWQVGSSATIGDLTSFSGNVLALTSVTLNSGATVEGRILAINGAVVLTSSNTITKP